MKKLLILTFILAATYSLLGQSPQKMSYQCIVRNNNNLVMNQPVGMRITILHGNPTGTVVYQEIYNPNPQTNINGLVTIDIGTGIPISGTFSSINWSAGPFFLKTEADPTGGTNYIVTGTTQLLSVPYALFASTAGNGFSGNYNDLSNKPALFDGTWTSLTSKPTTVSGYGITNAMTTSHAANNITTGLISNWNTAYTWGNHAGLYKLSSYVPNWTEVSGKPTFATIATTGSYNDLTNKPSLFDGTFASLTSKPTTVSGYGITDAITTAHAANSVTTGLITNWNTAYTWGNHATAGYVSGTRTITINGTTLNLSANNTWNVGSVTSVGLSLPSIFSVSGSPVTSLGTLSATLASQTANLVFASPNGAPGSPTFRALLSADLPNLDWSKITTGKPTTLSGYGITDAMNTSHPANSISAANITNWTSAFGWGDHSLAGYAKYPVQTGNSGKYLTTNGTTTSWAALATVAVTGNYNDLTNKPSFDGTFASLTSKPTTISGYGITDAMTTAHAANSVTSGLISNWNSAYGWGNHATAGYVPGTRTITINGSTLSLTANNIWNVGTVTSVGMSLPSIFNVSGSPVTSLGTLSATLASQTANLIFASPNGTAGTPVFRTLVSADLPNLDWIKITTGKPTTLAGYGITDAMSTSHAANIITPTLISNWNTAYTWGNHAGLYKLNSYVPNWTEITSKPTFAAVATSGAFADLLAKPTTLVGYGITDAMSTSHAANSITTANITNWTSSFSWGDHSLAGYAKYPSQTGNSGKYLTTNGTIASWAYLATVALTGSYNDLINKPTFDGTFASLSGKPTTVSGYSITDAMTTAHAANAITSTSITNWNTAFGWGNHATAGYVAGTRTITINGTTLNLSANNTWNVGTVTSVGLSLPGIFTVSGSPVTSLGTLSATLASQTANLVFASPNGAPGSPAFRALLSADLPNLDWSKITTGKPTTVSGYGITDAMTTAHAANTITSTLINNWNTAYTWGNHAGLYKLSSYVPTWAEINSKPIFAAVATSGTFADLLSKPTTLAGYGIVDAITTSSNQTISGNKTFIGTITVVTPVNDSDAATKAYVDALKTQISKLEDMLIASGSYKAYDIDGNLYNVVKIGTQLWMKENLKTTKYNDGTAILYPGANNTDWQNNTTGAYAWPVNDEVTYKNIYGAYYNWYAVNTGKLCPSGWKVPSEAEWTILQDYLIANGYNYDGTTSGNKISLAMVATTTWFALPNPGSPGNDAYPEYRNKSGFSALPGGSRLSDGSFDYPTGETGIWWTSTQFSSIYAYYHWIYSGYSYVLTGSQAKNRGYSIRCIKD